MRLQDYVIRAAEQTPDAIAIVGPDTTWTYAQLDARADLLARELWARGVRPGDRVGLWLEKSALAVAGMQAALRVGAAYVPLDPQSPPARIDAVIADCGLRGLLTLSARAEKLSVDTRARTSTLQVDDIPAELPLPHRRFERGPSGASPEALAYVLYTSGSTGRPKGVCISHRNATAFVEWAAGAVDASAEDRFANHAPFHFDLSVFDLYVAFEAGASVHLIPEAMAYLPTRLVRFVVEQEITTWYSVPSALVLMLSHAGLAHSGAEAHLRRIIFAGEPFPPQPLRALRSAFPRARLWNFYGPTETNVCTAHELDAHWSPDHSIPIGAAVSGDEVWARTDDGRVAELGERGELMVSGPSVMLGYWGQAPQQGPYATGDVVRRIEEGFEFIGRRDHRVKLRGHRVELGEIEAVLADHPEVEEAAVRIEGAGMQAELVATIVTRAKAAPGLLELKQHCAAQLPRYMNIDRVEPRDALPRTRNGKLDRRRLQAGATEERPSG